jgi:23S rRNA pseudouridine1911/1915/1917 synthase
MTVTVTPEGDGMRADAFLALVTDLSRTAAARLCETGAVRCEGRPVGKKTALRAGELLTVTLPEPQVPTAAPQEIPLDIVYEDADLLVINKPCGMVVHPAAGNPDGTLVNALLAHCKGQLSGIGGELRPGIVHRIDKDTSGLLVVAKNDATHRALSEQLAYHGVSRVYYALACGGFREERGTVNAPIGRHPTDRKKMAVIRDGSHTAREAITHYEVLRAYGAVTYLKLQLETGRTHQIRVHMASIGHPLLGDTLYGGGHTAFEKAHAAYLHGQCLHAGELTFVHPATGKTLHFECPLPDDFRHLLQILEHTI